MVILRRITDAKDKDFQELMKRVFVILPRKFIYKLAGQNYYCCSFSSFSSLKKSVIPFETNMLYHEMSFLMSLG